jgi:hypothetical protein
MIRSDQSSRWGRKISLGVPRYPRRPRFTYREKKIAETNQREQQDKPMHLLRRSGGRRAIRCIPWLSRMPQVNDELPLLKDG